MPPLDSSNVSIIVAIVLIAVIGCVVYQLVKMRNMYQSQRAEFARVISIVNDFKQIHPGMITLLQRLDDVGKNSDIQKANLQELDLRIESHEAHLNQIYSLIIEIMYFLINLIQEVGRKTQTDSIFII